MTGDIGDDCISAGGNHHRPDRQTIQAIRQVDGIRRADNHQHRERHVEGSQIDMKSLDKRHGDFRAEPRLIIERHRDHQSNEKLAEQFAARREPFAVFARELQSDYASPHRGDQREQHVAVGDVAHHQCGKQKRQYDQRAAHGRCSRLDRMAGRSVVADLLADLFFRQSANQPRPEQKRDQ